MSGGGWHTAPNRKKPRLKPANSALRAPDTSLPSAGRESQADDCYQILKWNILTQKIAPGTLCIEEELCALVGYGRTPVHQALHRLKYDGLVDILPRKGIMVRAFSTEAINQLIEARLPLEVEMARLAAQRASPQQVRDLRATLAKGRDYLRRNDLEALMTLDRDFHRGLARCTGNPVLIEMLEALHQRSLILWHVAVPARGPEYDAVHSEHVEVLRYIAARDADGAAKAMRMHIERFIRR